MMPKFISFRICIFFIFLFSFWETNTLSVYAQEKKEWEPSRWIDSEGRKPITYEEWKDRLPPVRPFEAGYSYRSWVPPLPRRVPALALEGKILIIVNSGIKDGIQLSLNQYSSDLETEGYNVIVSTVSGGTPEDLRAYLQSELVGNLVGCVLIGDLPVPWFELDSDWGHEEFPCDLFYMDLDGTWGDTDNDGKIDTHSPGNGDTKPEIWVGRLTASPLTGNEIELLKNYFTKNHKYRMGNLSVNKRALMYRDDPWYYYGNNTIGLDLAYGDVTVVYKKEISSPDDYKQRLTQGYEWVHLVVHSSYLQHGFDEGWVTYSDIQAINPKVLFYNLYACSAARYVENDYIGGWYIFSSTYGLAAVGTTKTGGMHAEGTNDFYTLIGQNKSLGESFKGWFISRMPYDETDKKWYYGMTLLGDPTLKINPPACTLAKGLNSPDPTYEMNNSTNVVMLQFAIHAGSEEGIRISKITFTASGTGNDCVDITSVKLYSDDNGNGKYDGNELQIGTNQKYSADNGTVIFELVNSSITKSTVQNFLLAYDFAGTASDGATFSVSLSTNTDIIVYGVETERLLTPYGFLPIFSETKTLGSVVYSNGKGGGNWNDINTWSKSIIPGEYHTVVIPKGDTVIFNQNDSSTTCRDVTIGSGSILKFGDGTYTMQVRGNIIVNGTLNVQSNSALKIECAEYEEFGVIVNSGGIFKADGTAITFIKTTITGDIISGSDSFVTVENTGWAVGDKISVGTTNNKPTQTELKTITQITENFIKVDSSFTYNHSAGALVTKNNRDCQITSANSNCPGYILVNAGGILDFDYVEISHLGRETYDKNGITLKTESSSTSIYGCSIHDGFIGIALDYSCKNALIENNVIYSNTKGEGINKAGISLRGSSNIIVSNIIYLNYPSNNWGIDSSGTSNHISSNTIYSNANGGVRLWGGSKNIIDSNIIYANGCGICLAWSSNNIIINNKILRSECEGIVLNASNGNILSKNIIHSHYSGISSWSSTDNEVIDCVLEENREADIYITAERDICQLTLKNCLLNSTTEVYSSRIATDSSYVISQKHDQVYGLTKIWGNYEIPKDSTLKWNYAEESYQGAGDTNVQKLIKFYGRSKLVCGIGETIEIKGASENPTLIDSDNSNYYTFIVSGTIDANYFKFNLTDNNGIQILGKMKNMNNGIFNNVKAGGTHLFLSGKIDTICNNIIFDNSGDYDVHAKNNAEIIFIDSTRGNNNDWIEDTSSVIWTIASPSTVTVSGLSVTSTYTYKGQNNIAMEKIYLTNNEGDAVWTDIKIDRIGTGNDSDISAVKIYLDTGDRIFDPNQDFKIGIGTFVSSTTNIDIINQVISTQTCMYFIAIDISSNAVPGHSLGVSCRNNGYLTVVAPDEIANANFPLESEKLRILIECSIGGTIVGSDGKTKVEIPANALPEDGYIVVTPNPSSDDINEANRKDDLDLTLNRIDSTITEFNTYSVLNTTITAFKKDVTIFILYDDKTNDGIVDNTNPPMHEKTLKIYTLNKSSECWEEIPNSIVDSSANIVSGLVSHFSVFVLMGMPIPEGIISGKVTKSDGVTAISGALVETLQNGIMKSSTTTDSRGNYSIIIATGTYDVRASANGYVTKISATVVVIDKSTTTVNFVLLPIYFSDLKELKVYPNPYKPSKGHTKIVFANLSANATIKIFTFDGELVWEKENITTGSEEWLVVNKDNEKVASGVYIYFITNDRGERKFGKLAIIR